MRIVVSIVPDRVVEIGHDGTVVRFVFDSAKDGHIATIRIDGDPLITHGFKLQAGRDNRVNLREIDS